MDRVLFVVAHPDDVAFGMGGTALLMRKNFEMHVICATRGERAWKDHTLEETGKKREQEEINACAMINAGLFFLDKIDMNLEASEDVFERASEIIKRINPRAIFTLWPIDCHPDHSAIYEITRKALRLAEKKVELYFCEEGFGIQTTAFSPDIYVDISDVMEEKINMLRMHECQNINDRLVNFILKQNEYRGLEVSCKYAEAYKMITPFTNKTKSVLMEI